MNTVFQKYFAATSEEMDYADYELLAQSGETNVIDRKSIRLFDDVKHNRDGILSILSKALSAFTNYEGGILLIGVADDGSIEEGVSINNVGRQSIKEWLENVLWTCVTPPTRSFSVKYTILNGKYLYAIFIGKSEIAPHQAAMGDGRYKYFSRVSGTSQPIDGVLVRDIFSRRTNAILEPDITIHPINDSSPNVAKLQIAIMNKSMIPGEKVCMLLKLSEPKINGSIPGFSRDGGQFNGDIVYPQVPLSLGGPVNLMDFTEMHCVVTLMAQNMLMNKFVYLLRKVSQQHFAIIPIPS